MNRRGRQALSPHGEEAYKDLIYLNDAYKRAIIDSQGHEKKLKKFVRCGNFFEFFAVEQTWFEHLLFPRWAV